MKADYDPENLTPEQGDACEEFANSLAKCWELLGDQGFIDLLFNAITMVADNNPDHRVEIYECFMTSIVSEIVGYEVEPAEINFVEKLDLPEIH